MATDTARSASPASATKSRCVIAPGASECGWSAVVHYDGECGAWVYSVVPGLPVMTDRALTGGVRAWPFSTRDKAEAWGRKQVAERSAKTS